MINNSYLSQRSIGNVNFSHNESLAYGSLQNQNVQIGGLRNSQNNISSHILASGGINDSVVSAAAVAYM